MTVQPNGGRVKYALVAGLLVLVALPPDGMVAPTAGGASDSGPVTLTGVRTGVTYYPVEAVSPIGCWECALVPKREWLWINGEIETPTGLILLSIHYMSGSCTCRTIDLLVPITLFPFLIPPANADEDAIRVDLEDVAAESSAIPERKFLFPTGNTMPTDGREIVVRPAGEWIHAQIGTDASDQGLIIAFGSSPASASGVASSFFMDALYEGGNRTWWVGSYALGGAGARAAITLGVVPPVADAVVALPSSAWDASASPVFGLFGELTDVVVDARFGRVGPTHGPDGLIMFSLNGSIDVNVLERGELQVAEGRTMEGVRTHTSHAAIQIGELRASATFDGVGMVLASASGGTFGSGSARIEHAGHFAESSISNIGVPLSLVSHGDCDGDWSTSVRGAAVGGTGASNAILLGARGYTPSLDFQRAFATNNGWCE